MIGDYFSHTKHLVSKSLLLSFLFHLIVIYSFVFLLPLLSASHKPKIVFLGQILQHQDTSHSKSLYAQSDTSKSLSPALYMNNKENNPAPYTKKTTEKPHQKKATAHDKINMKSVFSTSYTPKKQSDEKAFTEELEEYFSNEEYQPLAFPK